MYLVDVGDRKDISVAWKLVIDRIRKQTNFSVAYEEKFHLSDDDFALTILDGKIDVEVPEGEKFPGLFSICTVPWYPQGDPERGTAAPTPRYYPVRMLQQGYGKVAVLLQALDAPGFLDEKQCWEYIKKDRIPTCLSVWDVETGKKMTAVGRCYVVRLLAGVARGEFTFKELERKPLKKAEDIKIAENVDWLANLPSVLIPISFTCPYCGHFWGEYEVEASQNEIECEECGNDIEVDVQIDIKVKVT